ncbi:MAG: allantoinase AllB [Chloroflexi bacterium]|nr:allantoinase AllB [Chloroflexota bacterium]
MFDLVVANGAVVTPSGCFTADLGVKSGRIAAVGSGLAPAAEVVDGRGLHVLPGLIDVHVHFREPGVTYKEDFGTGSLAAAAGGVTTAFDMPNTQPPTATAALFHEKVALACAKSWIDFGLYGVILQDNEAELAGLAEAGAIGYKLFMGETTGKNACPTDDVIFGAFRRAAALDRVVNVHAENDPILQRLKRELRAGGRTDARAHLDSRPAFVEAEAVGRAIAIAEGAGNHLHVVHVSTQPGLDRIAWAKSRGARVTCEVLIAHLVLDDTSYERYGNLTQLNPPLREPEHVAALWHGIRTGQIDCIATDHAPHSAEEQARTNVWEGVGGFIGVETLLPLLLTQAAAGRLTLEQVVRLTAENPARIYGLYPRKGTLAVGADADFVLVDTKAIYRLDQATLRSRHPVTPYHGWTLTGRPVATYLRGTCHFRDGQPQGTPRGRLVTPPYGGTAPLS